MNAMILFSAEAYTLDARAVTGAIKDSFGLHATPWHAGAEAKKFPPATDEGQEGLLRIDLPELEENEGDPICQIEVRPRLDRDEDFQTMIDEIVSQEKALDKRLNHNKADIIIQFEDTAAGFEAACMAAFVLADSTASGVLVPAFEEGEETLWFDNADDFAAEIFQDDEDELSEDEEGDEEDER